MDSTSRPEPNSVVLPHTLCRRQGAITSDCQRVSADLLRGHHGTLIRTIDVHGREMAIGLCGVATPRAAHGGRNRFHECNGQLPAVHTCASHAPCLTETRALQTTLTQLKVASEARMTVRADDDSGPDPRVCVFVLTCRGRCRRCPPLQEEKRLVDRRRNLITLITRHLMDSGYVESAERLQAESSVSLSKFDVADNIDLVYILGVRRGAGPCGGLPLHPQCDHTSYVQHDYCRRTVTVSAAPCASARRVVFAAVLTSCGCGFAHACTSVCAYRSLRSTRK